MLNISNILLEPNPIAFNLFGKDIYWYGVIISLAILLCVVVAIFLCKAKKISTDMPLEIFLAIIPLGILSARLFSVIFEKDLSLADYFNFSTGGMSIIGAIIGGALGALIYKLIKKKPFLLIADVVTSVLLLGQAIGRWGNYFNSEVYGGVVTDTAWQVFPFSVEVNGIWHEALFFYEFILSLIGFVALLIIYLKTNKTGLVTGLYLVYYGVVRTILEPRRSAEYILKWGNIPVSLLISILFIVIGVSVLVTITILHFKHKKENNFGREEIHK